MSRITGKEPRHWHGPRGEHRMVDPRKLELKRCYLDPDQRRYIEHLEAHEEQARDPQPRPDDGPAVRALFEHIECLETTVAKEKLLIIALRQKAAQAPEPDGKES